MTFFSFYDIDEFKVLVKATVILKPILPLSPGDDIHVFRLYAAALSVPTTDSADSTLRWRYKLDHTPRMIRMSLYTSASRINPSPVSIALLGPSGDAVEMPTGDPAPLFFWNQSNPIRIQSESGWNPMVIAKYNGMQCTLHWNQSQYGGASSRTNSANMA